MSDINPYKKHAEELALKIEEMQADHKQTSERLITVIESFLLKHGASFKPKQ